MTDDTRRVIYIHIPRTGGQTIEKLFGFPLDQKNKWGDGHHHFIMSKYIKKWPKKWNKYFTFTFIRNPWDRILSIWSSNYFVRNNKKFRNAENWRRQPSNNFEKQKNDFNFFVTNILCKRGLNRYLNGQCRPQIMWFNINGIFSKSHYDFIGKYENFKKDVKYICNEFKLEYDKNIWISKTPHYNYKDYYTNESKKIVEEMYRDDIEYLGYRF